MMIQLSTKHISLMALLGVLTLGLTACSWLGDSSVPAQESIALRVVNVLDKPLYDDCHIKGSINVPFMEVEEVAKSWNKDGEVVFYCSNYQCTASGAAARQLEQLGFENVFVYDAGMAAWYQSGLPVEGACAQGYLKMVNNKPDEREQGVKLIDTQKLYDKMKVHIYKAA